MNDISGRLPVGTRVRVNDRGAWPERRGCLATVVDYPEPGVYPDPVGPGEVLLLLDDDPLAGDEARFYAKWGSYLGAERPRGWTCVERRSALDLIP